MKSIVKDFMGQAFEAIKRNHLSLKLTPISIRELLFINDSPCDIFGLDENGLLKSILHKNHFINKNILRNLIESGQVHLFVFSQDRELLMEYVQNALTKVTRSLSVGNKVDKVKKQMNLLSINMGYLYQNPTNDDLLKIQHQCAKNLAYFLLNHVNLHEHLYKEYLKQKHHFIFAQPMLSSLFVLGVMKYSQVYSDQEIENLFITSYFKDIGMSAIPIEKYDQDNLSKDEKILLSKHTEQSVKILKGRIPITPNHLAIIRYHHSFSLLETEMNNSDKSLTPSEEDSILGFETVIVTVMDIVSAMISGRPYRKASNLFESLDLVKILISEQYPREFRLIVSYFKSFFFDK